jgi:uncharacterized protein YdeI (YjbR/CyaY-like superfamily)
LKLCSERFAVIFRGSLEVFRVSEIRAIATTISYIKKAMTLNEEGVRVARPKNARPSLDMPDYFMAAIEMNKKALAAYTDAEPASPRHANLCLSRLLRVTKLV